jgi:hypothetical protein
LLPHHAQIGRQTPLKKVSDGKLFRPNWRDRCFSLAVADSLALALGIISAVWRRAKYGKIEAVSD